MNEQKPKRRQEDGRPKKYENGFKRVSISLPTELAPVLKELGGSAWIQEQIKKAIARKGQ